MVPKMIDFYSLYTKPGLVHYKQYKKPVRQWCAGKCTVGVKKIKHIIKREPEQAYYYARYIIKGRWPEAEPIILTHNESAYYYAYHVVQGKWPEFEQTILTNPHMIYRYCDLVTKERWVEAEPYIMKDPFHAYRYAKYIMKERWLEAEQYIQRNKQFWRAYCGNFDVKEGV